jgi:hypothetical protein
MIFSKVLSQAAAAAAPSNRRLGSVNLRVSFTATVPTSKVDAVKADLGITIVKIVINRLPLSLLV